MTLLTLDNLWLWDYWFVLTYWEMSVIILTSLDRSGGSNSNWYCLPKQMLTLCTVYTFLYHHHRTHTTKWEKKWCTVNRIKEQIDQERQGFWIATSLFSLVSTDIANIKYITLECQTSLTVAECFISLHIEPCNMTIHWSSCVKWDEMPHLNVRPVYSLCLPTALNCIQVSVGNDWNRQI